MGLTFVIEAQWFWIYPRIYLTSCYFAQHKSHLLLRNSYEYHKGSSIVFTISENETQTFCYFNALELLLFIVFDSVNQNFEIS